MKFKPSPRYRVLEKGITQLRRRWLPRKLDPTGTYPDRIHDKAVAFRIFAHAEVEQYVEDRVKEVALTHMRAWKSDQKTSRVILGLVGYYSGERKAIVNTKSSGSSLKSIQDVSHFLNRGMSELHHQLSQNNGVKEDDLIELLTRVGVLADDLDQTWLNQMNSWGAERGEFVHRSPSLTFRPIDPANEIQVVRTVLDGLKDIDLKLSSF